MVLVVSLTLANVTYYFLENKLLSKEGFILGKQLAETSGILHIVLNLNEFDVHLLKSCPFVIQLIKPKK